MVTVRSTKGNLDVIKNYNEHFDSRLWVVAEAGELKPGVPYDQQNSCVGEPDPSAGSDPAGN